MKKAITFLIISCVLASTLPRPANAISSLLKSAHDDAIYYYDSETNTRHPFPNATTYQSWYGNDFSGVTIIADDLLSNIPLGANITIRPGTYLVKAQTAPAVYAVEAGGVLRQLLNEDIAQGIYGPQWQQRIVAVPDVFFDDYEIGKMIRSKVPIPDETLYYHTELKTYYYKQKGVAREFATYDALRANNFDTRFAVRGTVGQIVRSRPITGFDPLVFNPTAEQRPSTADCEAADLRGVMIMVTMDGVSEQEYTQLNGLKDALPQWYADATRDFAHIDMSDPVVVVQANEYTIGEEKDGTYAIKNEVIHQLYDTHDDVYDFIFVWSDFAVPIDYQNELAHYLRVSNTLSGIGVTINDQGSTYGSNGKLKGIIVMGPVSRHSYESSEGFERVLHLMTHEIGHQWAGYIGFEDTTGEENYSLLSEDRSHWSYYATMFSPVGGTGWRDNGNGTFTSGFVGNPTPNRRQFSQLELYLMGLIPYQFISEPISYIVPDVAGAQGATIYGREVTVDPKSIVDLNGKVACTVQ